MSPRAPEARLLKRSRASHCAALLALLSLAGTFATAADEPADPISRLGQRSALERWKDARSEWMTPGMLRRERRQQRHGVVPEPAFAGDPAAPEAPAVVPVITEPPEEPVRVENEPRAFPTAPPTASQFIVPPRTDRTVSREGEAPAEPDPASDHPSDSTIPRPLTDGTTAGSPEKPGRSNLLPDVPPSPGSSSGGPSPSRGTHVEPPAAVTLPQDAPAAAAVTDPLPAFIPIGRPIQIVERPLEPATLPETEVVVIPLPPVPLPIDVEFESTPAPSQDTAFLPQIPRPPVAPSPTPAPPPTRVAPAPAPRLPDERPSFIVPRSVVPPAPDAPPTVAGPVELPQLKKITDIQPFRTCSTDGGGVRMCPPNTVDGGDRCPEQIPLPVFEGSERNFIDLDYCWEASNLFHTPLWFEDVALERYGHTYCEPIQSITSVGKFGTQLVGLPYQMAMAPVHKREYPLGYYRPGDPAPHKAYQIPLNAEAAIKAAYVYTGMSFILP